MKVLVVEDTLTDRVLLETILLDLGHEILSADTGKLAVQYFLEFAPDIVLLDVLLPDMNGLEVVKVIREQSPSDWVPIIFLSSRISPDDILLGITAGGDDYLTKPVDDVILKAKMKSMERISKMRRKLISVSDELSVANTELQKLVGIDQLTGIANRRQLEHHFQMELGRCLRFKQYMTMMLIDVDHFKHFNDHYGHLDGDKCLTAIAQKLDNILQRSSDFVARYGGEEFAVILHGNTLDEAVIVADKLKKGIYDLNIEHSKSMYNRVTISIGLSVKIPVEEDRFATFIKEADMALYNAKNNGRNGVISYQHLSLKAII